MTRLVQKLLQSPNQGTRSSQFWMYQTKLNHDSISLPDLGGGLGRQAEFLNNGAIISKINQWKKRRHNHASTVPSGKSRNPRRVIYQI
ncbi:unnamed protein product [Moneuplotes crassus]|uniref:Uncharacterized protein n=1 Tax=Euplotes crassus TaxID=5936 RepID=A0AAD1X8P0_EUPCR|nr:unnamed protein product [Moneuplotes crassus]